MRLKNTKHTLMETHDIHNPDYMKVYTTIPILKRLKDVKRRTRSSLAQQVKYGSLALRLKR